MANIYIDDQARELAIRLTQELVRIPSPYGQEGPVGEYLARTLTGLGFQVEVQKVEGERRNVLAVLESKRERPGVIMQGHMDTMPVFGMDDDPFAAKLIAGGSKIFGRGSADMKGGIACCIAAADFIRRTRPRRDADIVLAFTVDEESQKKGIARLIEDLPPLNFGICAEPTGLKLALCQKGALSLKFTTFGRQTHGSTPEKGINAVLKMARLLMAIDKEPLERVFVEGVGEVKGTASVGVIRGGEHFMFVPDYCEAWMDRRYPPNGPAPQEILAHFKALIAGLKAEDPDFQAQVEIRRQDFQWEPIIQRGIGPFLVPLASPVAQLVSRAHQTVLGREVEHLALECWTEADFLNHEAQVPTVVYGPGQIGDAHSTHENVPVEHLIGATGVYAAFLTEVVG